MSVMLILCSVHQVESLIVSGSTDEWQANMLKAILSPLQVNAHGARLIKDSQNSLPEANSSSAVFTAMEVRNHNYGSRTHA
jgi:hypothetical protein